MVTFIFDIVMIMFLLVISVSCIIGVICLFWSAESEEKARVLLIAMLLTVGTLTGFGVYLAIDITKHKLEREIKLEMKDV